MASKLALDCTNNAAHTYIILCHLSVKIIIMQEGGVEAQQQKIINEIITSQSSKVQNVFQF